MIGCFLHRSAALTCLGLLFLLSGEVGISLDKVELVPYIGIIVAFHPSGGLICVDPAESCICYLRLEILLG